MLSGASPVGARLLMIIRNASKASLLTSENPADQWPVTAHDHSHPTRTPPASGSTRRAQSRYRHHARDRSRPARGSAAARTAAAAGISEFRQHCALNGTQAPAGKDASPSPAAVTSGPGDPAHRTPDADPAASSARVRRGLPSPRSGGSRIARPGRHRSRRQRPRRRESRTGGRSLPPAIPYPFTPACRHRYPRDPGNAQAVPGINLRVNSQTNIRAQLVKQS